MEIEFYNIDWRGDHVVASYSLTDERTTTTVKHQEFSTKALIKFIEENQLNAYYPISPDYGDLEYMDAPTYLEENYYDITKLYISCQLNNTAII